jgi:formylglycine-generating enzyme required for sulfatase activity
VAFANWLSARTGKAFRLCTEAEWERACRGEDERTYPWGDDSLDFRRANYGGNEGTTTLIGAYSPQGDSPYGVADMMGNAWEWTASLDSPYPYDPNDGRESMKISGRRVVRGGSFLDNEIYTRCSARNSYFPDLIVDQFGFRVCTSQ